jgi:hypothetical protein
VANLYTDETVHPCGDVSLTEVHGWEQELQKGGHLRVSWGPNNRTVLYQLLTRRSACTADPEGLLLIAKQGHGDFGNISTRSLAALRSQKGMKTKKENRDLQAKANTSSPLLTEAEQVKLLRCFKTPRGNGFTEAEADVLFKWAAGIRLSQGLLENALDGLVRIDLREDGQLEFEAVAPEEALKKLREAGTLG